LRKIIRISSTAICVSDQAGADEGGAADGDDFPFGDAGEREICVRSPRTVKDDFIL
jgi:hypothetical protein